MGVLEMTLEQRKEYFRSKATRKVYYKLNKILKLRGEGKC